LDILLLENKTSNMQTKNEVIDTFLQNLEVLKNLNASNLTIDHNITFDGNLNNISSNVVNYIANLTSDVQQQINDNYMHTSNYLQLTSNYLEEQIIYNDLDILNLQYKTSNLSIINSNHHKFVSDITIDGLLITSNLQVIGETTQINTVTYKTENMEKLVRSFSMIAFLE